MRKYAFIIALVFALAAGALLATASHAAKDATSIKVPTAQQMNFVGDSKTMRFHYPTCKKCPNDATRMVPLDSPLSATRAGFKPCSKCHPPTK